MDSSEDRKLTNRAKNDKETHGKFEIALQGLPAPEREFYCNTVQLVERPDVATFVFGQFGPGTINLQNAVAVDVPIRCLQMLVGSFDDAFRSKLDGFMTGLTPIDPFAIDQLATRSKEIRSVSYAGHLVKILINDYAAVLDFYELGLTFEEPPVVSPVISPVIRIKSLPAVIRWFVDSCDRMQVSVTP